MTKLPPRDPDSKRDPERIGDALRQFVNVADLSPDARAAIREGICGRRHEEAA